jgi:group I intron endonuclease
MYYLYKITCIINGKIYIGQTIDYNQRWRQHKWEANREFPRMIINKAMKKYGIDNFVYEVIATCKNIDDANETEAILIKQYESHISIGKGYNVSNGGNNAPKSEEFKQMMRDWHLSLSLEEKQKRSNIHRESIIKQTETQGHPALGNKWTNEQKAKLSESLKAIDKDKWYTDEVRLHMSEAHFGIKDSEETKKNKSNSAKEAWKNRIDYSNIKCSVPNCDVCGKAKYKIVDGTRYCVKHGLRLLRYGRLDLLNS